MLFLSKPQSKSFFYGLVSFFNVALVIIFNFHYYHKLICIISFILVPLVICFNMESLTLLHFVRWVLFLYAINCSKSINKSINNKSSCIRPRTVFLLTVCALYPVCSIVSTCNYGLQSAFCTDWFGVRYVASFLLFCILFLMIISQSNYFTSYLF